MSILAKRSVSTVVAKTLQGLVQLTRLLPNGGAGSPHSRFPEFPRNTRELTIPTSVAPARVVVYLPEGQDERPPVYVNFHGGGYILAMKELDDPLCRYLAAEAGVVVVNVDYAVAPKHRFPAPARQAFEVVEWVAEHGAAQGWDGGRLLVGGQSAGGGLAAAVARQVLEQGGPPIALQVLHYAPLDLATHARDKRSAIAKPMLRPWMAEVFNTAYVPDERERTDRLVSPAHPADTADITGIAPALVLTPEFDLLRGEGRRYAERLRRAGALVEHRDIPGVDHNYDARDFDQARKTYALIAHHVRQATHRTTPEAD
ncbi:MAG: alpha/beta hydrolase fold domain-containing protein [Umezawaea sp.]